jgi:hypothetical protein
VDWNTVTNVKEVDTMRRIGFLALGLIALLAIGVVGDDRTLAAGNLGSP